jgi:hypothetical protein
VTPVEKPRKRGRNRTVFILQDLKQYLSNAKQRWRKLFRNGSNYIHFHILVCQSSLKWPKIIPMYIPEISIIKTNFTERLRNWKKILMEMKPFGKLKQQMCLKCCCSRTKCRLNLPECIGELCIRGPADPSRKLTNFMVHDLSELFS